MACPQGNNMWPNEIKNEQSIASSRSNWESGEQSTRYVTPVAIGALGGGIKEVIHEVKKILKQDDLSEKIVGKMQKTILMDGETIIRQILSGFVQTDFS